MAPNSISAVELSSIFGAGHKKNKTNGANNMLVVLQSYSTYVSEDHVILGNAAVLRCHIPSFVADTVHVDHWLVDDHIISATSNWGITLLPPSPP